MTWREQAACRDLPPEMAAAFYPPYIERSIATAQAICATCPVVRECLISDLRQTKSHYSSAGGARGGMGGLGRRRLIVALRDLDHAPERKCTDTECDWCVECARHQRNLDVVAGRRPSGDRERIEANGPGATHGRRSTFARGCRGGQCSASISTRSCGPVDLGSMWEDLLPGLPNDSLCDDNAPPWERDWLKHEALTWVRQEAAAA